MPYTYDPIEARDPSNPSMYASNASIIIFAPGDALRTPLAITDTTGSPLPNPITVNQAGYGPAFMHATLDRVAWAGAGFSNFFTSYEGMKNEAVAARSAAETAASSASSEAAAGVASVVTAAASSKTAAETAAAAAAAAAALVNAPADTAIEAAILGAGTKTKAALSSAFGTTSGAKPVGKGELFTYAMDFKTPTNTTTQAVQAAIDYAAGRVASGQVFGGMVWLGENILSVGKIYMRSGVYIWGGRTGGQGYREGPTRLLPAGLAAGEFLINQADSAVNVRQCGIIGISAYGSGATSTTGFINLPNASDLTIASVYADNWGAEAAIIGGGNHRISYSFFQGLSNKAAVTTRRGAFTLSGADHQVSHCEFTGPGRDTVSSASLYCHAALVSCFESEFDTCVFQIADVGMGQTGGSRNRWVGCRFDTNAGHGIALWGGTYGKFTGCAWSRNSYSGDGLYDHFHVPSDGGSINSIESPMFTNNGKNVRYNINDAKSSGTFYNFYINAFGDSGTAGFYNVTGSSVVQIPDNPPVDISGATPSVLNRKFVAANNASAVTVTDFLGGTPGQRITIFARDAGNTTIQHNNTTIVTKSGANIALGASGSADFVKRTSTQWREV